MTEIYYGVGYFLAIQFVLVTIIVIAKKTLLPSGEITININEEKTFQAKPGGKLLQVRFCKAGAIDLLPHG